MTAPVVELVAPAVGGIRAHVTELTVRLRERGRKVVVAGPAAVLAPRVATDAIVDMPSSPSPIGLVRARRQLSAARRLHGSDVIHAHGLKAGWVAIGSRPRPHVVLTAHNVVLADTAGIAAPALRFLERAIVRRVDQLISPSPAIDARFADLLPPERRHVILPVSPPVVAPRPRAEVRAELGVSDDHLLVVAPARLHPQKDLPMLLRSLPRVVDAHPNLAVRLVGEGRSRAELTGLIGELGLGGIVSLAGASPRAVDQIAAADLVAISSVWEAVPLVLVEAMSLGVPVVTTRVGIADQLIEPGRSGWLVETGDIAGMTAALLDALADASRRTEVGSAGQLRAAELADAGALVDAVDRVYGSMTAGARR